MSTTDCTDGRRQSPFPVHVPITIRCWNSNPYHLAIPDRLKIPMAIAVASRRSADGCNSTLYCHHICPLFEWDSTAERFKVTVWVTGWSVVIIINFTPLCLNRKFQKTIQHASRLSSPAAMQPRTEALLLDARLGWFRQPVERMNPGGSIAFDSKLLEIHQQRRGKHAGWFDCCQNPACVLNIEHAHLPLVKPDGPADCSPLLFYWGPVFDLVNCALYRRHFYHVCMLNVSDWGQSKPDVVKAHLHSRLTCESNGQAFEISWLIFGTRYL